MNCTRQSIAHWLVLSAIAMCAGCTPAAPPSGPPAATPSTAPAEPSTVTVAAASDLKFALDEVIAEFKEEHPETEVAVTYGSSGNFFAQLSNKAPFDIYFSADIEYPRKLIEAGHADKATEFQYAIGQIVVWAPKSSPLDIEGQGVQALLDPSVKKIAIANPEHAPYGRAAEAAMKQLGVYDQVKDKLVLGENISQTAQFIETGAADVGIIALSLALAPAMSEKGKYAKVPLDAYSTMDQGGVILNWAKDPAAAMELREFVMGEHGRAILKRYGFLLPGE
ncbi:MAG: molybdate ABC transporter substrate-binding protein [Planctomycetia bacterium]|nr:molybdate ABC transporter substrate-binding protein [Planctomycetia bacterium]